jgi:glucuronosyltransferase
MSAMSKDEPESSLDRAVWWAEYTIRHKGTKHLRSSGLDLAWYQYLLLDIVAIVFLGFAITICILYVSLKYVYMYMTENFYKVKSKHD